MVRVHCGWDERSGGSPLPLGHPRGAGCFAMSRIRAAQGKSARLSRVLRSVEGAATFGGLDFQCTPPSMTRSAGRPVKPMKKFLVVCAAIAGGLHLAYFAIFPTAYLRYRLTLDVDVDGVTRTGSGVVEITYQGMPDWLSEIGRLAFRRRDEGLCDHRRPCRARIAVCRRRLPVFGRSKHSLDRPAPSGKVSVCSLSPLMDDWGPMTRRRG